MCAADGCRAPALPCGVTSRGGSPFLLRSLTRLSGCTPTYVEGFAIVAGALWLQLGSEPDAVAD
jgi:hypothetical protein